MNKQNRLPQPEDMTLPLVHPSILEQVESEHVPVAELHHQLLERDEELALQILRRAHALSGGDLAVGEAIARVGYESVEAKERATLVQGLSRQFAQVVEQPSLIPVEEQLTIPLPPTT